MTSTNIIDNTNNNTNKWDGQARKEILNLLDGGTPSDPASCDFGPWSGIVESLQDAYHQGGSESVTTLFNSLSQENPELLELTHQIDLQTRTEWTVDDLLTAEFPPPKWIIVDILPEGLTFLGGRPKAGKSWLALQIASVVSIGGTIFGRKVDQRKVLYLALEDSGRRLQDRLQTQKIVSTSTQAVFVTEWPALDAGGLDPLVQKIENEGFDLVIIDTFSRALRKSDQQDKRDMDQIVGALQEIAIRLGICILVIDHFRKKNRSASDPIEEMLGSTGKTASVDVAMGLSRSSTSRHASLNITGRDVENQELMLNFDPTTCTWQEAGINGIQIKNTNKDKVRNAIQQLQEQNELPTTTAIAELTGIDPGNVSRDLNELTNADVVRAGEKRGREQPYYLIQ